MIAVCEYVRGPTHLDDMPWGAVGLDDDSESLSAHLVEVAVHDACVEEGRSAQEFEELDVVVTVECRIDGRRKADECGLTHFLS